MTLWLLILALVFVAVGAAGAADDRRKGRRMYYVIGTFPRSSPDLVLPLFPVLLVGGAASLVLVAATLISGAASPTDVLFAWSTAGQAGVR